MNGIGRSSKNEEEILLSLEESLDDYNQTTGFVSSYTLPMSSSVATDSITGGFNLSSPPREGSASLIQPIHLTRLASLESTTSTQADDDDDQNHINNIFRPPSRSPSRSPQSKISPLSPHSAETSSPTSTVMRGSPKGHSIASDSTEATSNLHLSPPRLGEKQRYPSQKKAAVVAAKNAIMSSQTKNGAHKNNTLIGNSIPIPASPLDTAEISPILNENSPTKHKLFVDNHITDEVGAQDNGTAPTNSNCAAVTPTKAATTNNKKSKQKGKKNKQQQQQQSNIEHQQAILTAKLRKFNKNNLVIQPTPSSLSTRSQQRSSGALPPPHPLSVVQSYPPISSRKTSPNRGKKKKRTDSISDASESGLISAASEATPIITHGRRYSPSYSFSSDEDSDDNDDTEDEDEELFGGQIPNQISTPLRGADISFVDEAEGDGGGGIERTVSGMSAPDLDIMDGSQQNGSSSVPAISLTESLKESLQLLPIRPSNSHLQPSKSDVEYKGESFFGNANEDGAGNEYWEGEGDLHTRQFSKDEQFFEGIYTSGLQSLSFEEISITSADAADHLSVGSDNNSTGVISAGSCQFEEDDRIQSSEDLRDMERRILQWKKGRRQQSLISSEAGALASMGSRQQEASACKGQENKVDYQDVGDNDDYEDAMEMAPLTSKASNSNGKTGFENFNKPNGHKEAHAYQHHPGFWSAKFGLLGWLWNLIPEGDGYYESRSVHITTPKKSNTREVPRYYYQDESEDEEDESAGLTSPIPAHSRQRSKHYDDVDFDRNANRCSCCSWLCCCCSCCGNDQYKYTDEDGLQPQAVTWEIHSGWKKLLFISSLFLFLAYIFSNGKLEKHHDYLNPGYVHYSDGQVDPLARDNFVEKSRIVDDEDDYFTSHPMEDQYDDDDQFHYAPLNSYHETQHGELDEDDGIVADHVSTGSLEKQSATQQFNNLVGIDTIVVLGGHHTGKEWLIEKLDQLYPDIKVMGGFPIEDVESSDKSSHLRHPRHMKVIDPTSNKDIHHNHQSNGEEINRKGHTYNDEHRKSKSAHILVVSVFVNPYDWIELVHADKHREIEWSEFVKMKLPSIDKTILELRADNIRSSMIESAEQDGVKLVIPVQLEELVEPYNNFDNYLIESSGTLPGIIGLLDQIQARTGLHPEESVNWKEPSKSKNLFWADPVGCNGHICFQSINKMRENGDYIQYLNDNLDWEVENLVKYQKKSVPKPSVDRIVVLGERHSGAEWLMYRLDQIFPNTPIEYGFEARPGKWFQSPPDTSSGNTDKQTLVISVFLNPYDWVELMRQHPINAPTHTGMEWPDFVSSPWERKRSNLDLSLKDTANAKCSFGFSYDEIVPCKTKRHIHSDSFPLYELHPASSPDAGTPYSSILGLRADKIKNFLSVSHFDGVVGVIPIRYEDLVWDEDTLDDDDTLLQLSNTDDEVDQLPFPGIAGVVEKIRDQTSLVPDIDAGWIIDEEGVFKAPEIGVGIQALDPYYVKFLEDFIDWDVEGLVGYTP